MSTLSPWPPSRVRQEFIRFFQGKEHTNVVSSSVVPVDDPTLLFTNAGMNQFKPIFLGTELTKFDRACNTQKCIRAGGKHNDLDDVGKDTYHHTFFEMLGNWSFGDYFKKEAIEYAWELLVDVYKLPKDRIYVTYFGGDGNDNLEPDFETRDLWRNFLPDERVLPFGLKENFWEMGDTGPCGPCSEIHYDQIGDRNASSLVNRDDPSVIELWNIVFIEYDRKSDRSLKDLPNKHIDTGMGFERLSSILQGKTSNYDTDIFSPIFDSIREVTGARVYSGKVGEADVDNIDMAYRVVADHIRTACYAIADGCKPGGNKRESVLRSILRRGIYYADVIVQSAGEEEAHEGLFGGLVKAVAEVMGDVYPELREKEDLIRQKIDGEEKNFRKTLKTGERKFARLAKKAQGTVFSGKDAFELAQSDGIPLVFIQRMASKENMVVDVDAFEEAMNEHKEISRNKKKPVSSRILPK